MFPPNQPKRPDQAPVSSQPLFAARDTTLFRVGLSGAVLLLCGAGFLGAAYFRSDYWTDIGFAPDQPVQFSHRHHAGELRIDCRYCHTTVESAALAGLPTTQICLSCHSQIFTATTMLAPVIQSAAENTPLQWNRVTRLPDHVYFDHSIHVSKGVGCIACHGAVGTMALTARAEPLTMRWCLDCHRDPAPRLRPADELFTAVALPAPPPAQQAELFGHYDIHLENLTNCSTCHH